MKKTRLLVCSAIMCASYFFTAQAQVVKDYNPAIQRTTNIQYFKPTESHLFSGDCMPFYHEGTFYLYWLLDEGHHSGLDGLGGHQWALSTSTDLKSWTHYPVALGIDEPWEKSICTGSVIADGKKFYAFYSTRIKEGDNVHEQLSYAISSDKGLTFKKQEPNPFYAAPQECVSRDFRDPRVFRDDKGAYHLFISGYQKNPPIEGQGGYLVHLVSDDLANWRELDSPLTGQNSVPECCDYFKWNDWYYLIYSTYSDSYYLKSKQPYGPWEWPNEQVLVERWACVYKTAEWRGNRRIAVAFLQGKREQRDNEGGVFGGNILFRELHQNPDGTLRSALLPEVLPQMSRIETPDIIADNSNTKCLATVEAEVVSLDGRNGISLATMAKLPGDYRISFTMEPMGNYDEAGIYVKASSLQDKGYKVEFNPNKHLVYIYNVGMEGVENLRKPVQVDIILKGDIIDLNINNERSMINRLSEKKSENIIFFVKNGSVKFKDIKIYQID